MSATTQLTRGKAKSLYVNPHARGEYIMEFRDDLSAFNGEKLASIPGKGKVNAAINAYIMQYLSQHGIATHFISLLDDTHTCVKALTMLPIEAVVRNYAAGSLARRLQLEKGMPLTPPIFDLFLKSDPLGDPMINASQAITLGYATQAQLSAIEIISLKVNSLLCALFEKADLVLVDFKLEFGLDEHGQLVLADEFSPDGARIWDAQDNLSSLDKDRFRQSMGRVLESYQEIAHRLGITC